MNESNSMVAGFIVDLMRVCVLGFIDMGTGWSHRLVVVCSGKRITENPTQTYSPGNI